MNYVKIDMTVKIEQRVSEMEYEKWDEVLAPLSYTHLTLPTTPYV